MPVSPTPPQLLLSEALMTHGLSTRAQGLLCARQPITKMAPTLPLPPLAPPWPVTWGALSFHVWAWPEDLLPRMLTVLSGRLEKLASWDGSSLVALGILLRCEETGASLLGKERPVAQLRLCLC